MACFKVAQFSKAKPKIPWLLTGNFLPILSPIPGFLANLTADKIRSLFEIKYTEGASATEKTKEEDIFYHFANFLDELDNIASGKRKSWDVIDVPTEDDPQEVTKKDIT